tara:strand:- start:1316 stop:1819 length:504 start_codon:yes stop_codon:yes gene_type:complete
MTELMLSELGKGQNPLDVIEHVVSAHEWPFDRCSANEMSISIEGSWARYHLWFAWNSERSGLQFSCAFDFKAPLEKVASVQSLLAMMNEKLWLGHFDLWADEGMLMFRHTLIFSGGAGVTAEQIEDLVEISLKECEKFYPALHFVMWGGKSPDQALDSAMLETHGEA